MKKDSYTKLIARFEKVAHIRNAGSILMNDAQIRMPEGSANDRTLQMIALSEVAHSLLTAPDVGVLLADAEKNAAALTKEEQKNLSLMRRKWILATALSPDIVAEIARTESEGERLHTELRKSNDWEKMKGWYQHTFNLAAKIGKIYQKALGKTSVYEALLDSFSPSLTEDTVNREFAALEKTLPDLIRAAKEAQDKLPPPLPLQGKFPKAAQEALCKKIAAAMGFDFTRGRMDMLDVHPSCSGTPADVRFTTDCDESDFLSAVYSTIHEAGHALYSQGTPRPLMYQPAGDDMGMSVHESQSRIMEIQACHTPEFFEFLEKEARAAFNRPDDPALSAKNLERLINRVEPSLIRIQADEMTYPAHILLRHKLEKSLIEGTLSIDNLPKAWTEGIEKLLGVKPGAPSEGWMQDIHWPAAMIGYFPAYTLGDMIAAQLFNAACKAHPEIRAELKNGNFKPLKEWLNKNIHEKGSLLTTDELLTAATGEPLNAKHYISHLTRRYLPSSDSKNKNAPKP